MHILWSDKDPGDNLSLKGGVDLFSRMGVFLGEYGYANMVCKINMEGGRHVM